LLGRLAVLNQSVYYDKGWKRKFVSYCNECDRIPVFKRELVDGNWKYLAYGILEVIRNSTGGSDNKNEVDKQYTNQQEQIIGFEVAVRKGYYKNKEVNHYLGYSQMGTIDPNCKPPEPFDLAAITNACV
jgi:hypothetical protein